MPQFVMKEGYCNLSESMEIYMGAMCAVSGAVMLPWSLMCRPMNGRLLSTMDTKSTSVTWRNVAMSVEEPDPKALRMEEEDQ
ncbi:unnamed protein product [Arctogadus glacialis]